jgi:predicted dehydrogenase
MKAVVDLTGAKIYSSWQSLVRDPNIDCVIVATYHKILPKIVLVALKNKKHVLAEKPLGNNAKEAKQLLEASEKVSKVLKVGFNHRFHPAVLKAHELVVKKTIGKILYIRAVYGHGARKNYDLEWRIQKKYTAGGEMYDQGSHILDLSEWFVGNFSKVFASTKNYFWNKTSLEDNAFCQLESKAGQTVFFQVSLTQWKNKFTFEIYGDKGYLLTSGLGRSYGVETLVLGTGVGLGKTPVEQVWEFKGEDNSWVLEWKEFKSAIRTGKPVMSSAKDNFKIMTVMDSLYESSKKGKVVSVKALL